MREIKFRAWNGFRQEMNKVLNIGWLDKIYMNISVDTEKGQINYSDSPDNMECENIELMQYTGLKDKNGKEIYEGDILKYTFDGEEKIDYIEYQGNMFTYHNAVRWSLQEDEVIGNIYENPELLEIQN